MLLLDKRFKEEMESPEVMKNFETVRKQIKEDWKMDMLISKELVGHDANALNKPIYMWVVVIYKGAMLVRKEAKNTIEELVDSLKFFAENYEVEL